MRASRLCGKSSREYTVHVATTDEIDFEKVREFLAEKDKRRRESIECRLKEATEDFKKIVDHIIQEYNPPRIYQWGSLIHTDHFCEISDIDIAVEGLSGPEEYFAILGDIIKITKLPVDFIELDKISNDSAELIRAGGRLIYERDKNG